MRLHCDHCFNRAETNLDSGLCNECEKLPPTGATCIVRPSRSLGDLDPTNDLLRRVKMLEDLLALWEKARLLPTGFATLVVPKGDIE